jgi:hypothetical protein
VTEIDVEIGSGWVASIPVPPTSTDVDVITSDCRLVGWSLHDTAGGSGSAFANDNANGAITAGNAGNVALPHGFDSLLGFTIQLSTVGTAPMTVTVSNVSGGPFVYTIPTGQQSLSVTFPLPIQASGGAPTVAWSATASAVGNVSVFGSSSVQTIGVSTIVEIQDVGNILGESAMGPGGTDSRTIRADGVPCQGKIRIHVVKGTVTGVIYAYLTRDAGRWR